MKDVERLWTKSFICISVGTLFLFVAFYMLYPTLPLFIKQIGGSEAQVGLAMGVFMFASVALRPIVGGLLDRYGRRLFIVGGLLLFALAMYMYGWVGGIGLLMGIRVLHGFSWAISSTATQTTVTDLVPPSRRGEGLGWFGIAMTLAMAVGPMLGVWVTENMSYHALFLLGVCLTFAALLMTFGADIPSRSQSDTRKIEFLEKSVLPVMATTFFLFIAYSCITTFVPLFADSIKVNSGVFFLVYSTMLTLTRPIAGKLSDRYGETSVITPALVVTILGLVALSLSTGLWGIVVGAVLYGIGFGSAFPVLQATTIRLARPDRKGVANASFTTATDLGIGLGSTMLGWIFQHSSYQMLFITGAISVALSLFLFHIFVKRLLQRHEIGSSNASVSS